VKAAGTVGLRFLDHVVVASDTWASAGVTPPGAGRPC
jgi:20S proteasome alpha/beta subunit